MARTIAIGIQNFGDLRKKNYFYIDKTNFIKEWWESGDVVTLIARPRRFGKTLTMSMLEYFFSNKYPNQGELFEGLFIWQDGEYRNIQGTYPVISLSFANVKENTYEKTLERIYQIIADLYNQHHFLLESEILTEEDKCYFRSVNPSMKETDAAIALHKLSEFLFRYYGKKVLILLDEYDTPMQEAYVNGFWDKLVYFTRNLFNSAFKTNPYLERALMTGITRVSKESIFSDLNNLKVITTTSESYATAFGFTEEEVFSAMNEFGLNDKEKVKQWYDGFIFGGTKDIYNPWSILNYLDTGNFKAYWANTSSNSLVGKLLREGNSDLKIKFETLLQGGTITCYLDEQIVYQQLNQNEEAIWSLLLASGYLKVIHADLEEEFYEFALTNYEVERMFKNMIRGWFGMERSNYNDFVKALLRNDRKSMNAYMNRVALNTFSYFDTGKRPSGAEPERFYHGFVLGLLVELSGRYVVTSNRESGFGRYDVILEPLNVSDDGIIIEFKVYDPDEEGSLVDTVQAALDQIEQMHYEQNLIAHGIPEKKIRKYGFAFEGKKVLIG
jgi:hypothetical protein